MLIEIRKEMQEGRLIRKRSRERQVNNTQVIKGRPETTQRAGKTPITISLIKGATK